MSDRKIILEGVSDFILAFKILKSLGTSWTDFEAYELGLIDDKGTKIKSPMSKEEKEAYNSYNKIVFNLKRLLGKVVGKNQFAQRAVSLLLLKEGVQDATTKIILEKLELDNYQEENQMYESVFVEMHRIHV